MGKLKKYFRRLRDPRAANASYPLLEILFVALAAVLCGAKSCTDMSDFGRRKIDLLRRFVPLEKGVPSHDVFSDVFRMLDPGAFERVFRRLGFFRLTRHYEKAVKPPAHAKRAQRLDDARI